MYDKQPCCQHVPAPVSIWSAAHTKAPLHHWGRSDRVHYSGTRDWRLLSSFLERRSQLLGHQPAAAALQSKSATFRSRASSAAKLASPPAATYQPARKRLGAMTVAMQSLRSRRALEDEYTLELTARLEQELGVPARIVMRV